MGSGPSLFIGPGPRRRHPAPSKRQYARASWLTWLPISFRPNVGSGPIKDGWGRERKQADPYGSPPAGSIRRSEMRPFLRPVHAGYSLKLAPFFGGGRHHSSSSSSVATLVLLAGGTPAPALATVCFLKMATCDVRNYWGHRGPQTRGARRGGAHHAGSYEISAAPLTALRLVRSARGKAP